MRFLLARRNIKERKGLGQRRILRRPSRFRLPKAFLII